MSDDGWTRRRVLLAGGSLGALVSALWLNRGSIITGLSQKESDYVAGLDFEAYNLKVEVDGKITESPSNSVDISDEVDNWKPLAHEGRILWLAAHRDPAGLVSSVSEWVQNTSSSAITFTPYIGDFLESRVRATLGPSHNGHSPPSEAQGISFASYTQVSMNEGALPDGIRAMGRQDVESLAETVQRNNERRIINPYSLILRVTGNRDDYKDVWEPDLNGPLGWATRRVGYDARTLEMDHVGVELQATTKYGGESGQEPDASEFVTRLNSLVDIRNESAAYPFDILVALNPEQGYNQETGLWDPEVSREYWEKADAVVLNDLYCDKDKLPENIELFKEAIGDRKLYVRLYTGNIREEAVGKEKGDHNDLRGMMSAAYNAGAHGTFVNDGNGAWTFSGKGNQFDNGLREQWIKRVHRDLFGING